MRRQLAAALVMAGNLSFPARVRAEALLATDAWTNQPALPVAISRHRIVSAGSALLAIGGRDRFGKSQAAVFRSVLASGGGCGAWVRDRPLPAPLSDHAVATVNGRLFIAGGLKGGKTGDTPTDEVWTTTPGTDGSLPAWARAGSLPEPMQGHGLVAVGGRLYCVAGMGLSGCRSAVSVSQPGGDGRLGDWHPVTGLPAAVSQAAVLGMESTGGKDGSVRRYLVVIGGMSPGEGKTLVLPTAYVGPVFPDGSIPTWYLASTKLPGAWLGFGRCQTAPVAWHDTLFCFGGQDSLWFQLDTIVASRFNAARGELAPWGVVKGGSEMPQVTAAVVVKDSVYLVGGSVKGEVSARVFRGKFSEVEDEYAPRHPGGSPPHGRGPGGCADPGMEHRG